MAFNHVRGCDCPVGCCDCGPPERYSHVFVFRDDAPPDYWNQGRSRLVVWGMRSFHQAKNYAIPQYEGARRFEEPRVFKLGSKPWERFKAKYGLSDPSTR